jgi:hypothetical protein
MGADAPMPPFAIPAAAPAGALPRRLQLPVSRTGNCSAVLYEGARIGVLKRNPPISIFHASGVNALSCAFLQSTDNLFSLLRPSRVSQIRGCPARWLRWCRITLFFWRGKTCRDQDWRMHPLPIVIQTGESFRVTGIRHPAGDDPGECGSQTGRQFRVFRIR